MTNSVLSNRLIYVTSSTKLPQGVIMSMDSCRRSFLWTGKDGALGARSLVAWETVCKGKASGRSGCQKPSLQNTCSLLKLIHNFHLLLRSFLFITKNKLADCKY
jgi:hypothetical protein